MKGNFTPLEDYFRSVNEFFSPTHYLQQYVFFIFQVNAKTVVIGNGIGAVSQLQ